MTDFTTTLGSYLRHERECRGLALRKISEDTKVSLSLLEGLETDDISRWPGGIFRRAFVRSYAQCVGLDAEDVIRRFDRQFPPDGGDGSEAVDPFGLGGQPLLASSSYQARRSAAPSARSRLLGTAADLTVAVVLAFGCAAGGSRLLWPVLLIAIYYAVGVVLTGTSPMVALLTAGLAPAPPARQPHTPKLTPTTHSSDEQVARGLARHAARRVDDSPVGQRPGMQAPV